MKVLLLLLIPGILQAASLKNLNSEKAPYQLPKLPYAISALAPIIDEQTMTLHHGKHHQGYVDKLNAALGPDDAKKSLLDILKSTKSYPAGVRNNAGGHWNHAFFWTVLAPESKKTKMSSALEKKINETFGSFDKFKEQFEKQGQDLFGSGWVWLIKDASGALQIVTTINQDNPLMDIAPTAGTPVLALDVWEHAYYLTYQNRRAEYLKNFWKIINWDQVSQYYREK